jgi:hypothetical protein
MSMEISVLLVCKRQSDAFAILHPAQLCPFYSDRNSSWRWMADC